MAHFSINKVLIIIELDVLNIAIRKKGIMYFNMLFKLSYLTESTVRMSFI